MLSGHNDPDVWMDTNAFAPDFTLDVSPLTQDVCAPADAIYDIDVGQVLGYVDPVTLSTSGTPAGTSSAFSTNPVTPPGTSMLTLSNTGSATAGAYFMDIVGMAPTSTHTATVGLNLFDAVPGATTLVAPADGAVNVGSTPTFEWTAASGAASYDLDVATDAAFTSLVYTATVPAPATTHTPALALAPLTTYYWRVTPDNVCGPASPAPTFFFVTGAVVCSAPNLAIPDSGATSDTISIPSGGPLTDLNVYLDVSHTWVGDLAFSLQHVDTGTTAGILDRPGVPASTFGCSGNNIDATLDDEGTDGDAETTCLAGDPTLSGSLVPGDPPSTSLLAAFDGENLSGDWLLSISDNAGGDTGTLNQWCLAAEIDFPNINLAKTVGTDPGICAATSSLAVAPGTDVYYCYEVTNTGTITLSLHDLADDQLGTILSGFPFNLTPGASVWLTQTATITQPTINTATWTASNAGPTDVVSATASATVDLFANLQVAHLAPFAMDPGTAVTITLDGTPVLTNFAFADSTGYLPVAPGSYLVEITPAGSPTPAISGTVVLAPNQDYTALAVGDGVNQPLGLIALLDDNTAPAPGSFKLRLGHLAPFAPGLATADIRLQDGTPVLTDVNYADIYPGYLELPAGTYDLKITTPGGATTLIDPLPVDLQRRGHLLRLRRRRRDQPVPGRLRPARRLARLPAAHRPLSLPAHRPQARSVKA